METKPSSNHQFFLKTKDPVKTKTAKTSNDWPFSSRTTDSSGWRLVPQDDLVRVKWEYLRTGKERDLLPQDVPSRFFLDLPTDAPNLGKAKRPSETIYNAARFHSRTQISDVGSWAADLSCILFVTPMLIIAWYVTGAVIPEAQVIEIVNYLLAIQSPEDGGWPTYLGGTTTLMGTMLIYVALRLMGLPADQDQLIKARVCILQMGGAVYLPCWAKFWLAMLGLYKWEGTDPYPVEIWTMPEWVPVSPWKWYCIPRAVYLHMCYIAEKKLTIPSNPLLDEIRSEIYVESYSSLNFASTNGLVLKCERHQSKSWVLIIINWLLLNIWYPFFRLKSVTERAEEKVWGLIEAFDKSSNSSGIICLDAFLSMIAFYCREGPDSKKLRRIQENSLLYLWMRSDGMQAMSIPGGQVWETSFALQSLALSGAANKPELRDTTQRAYQFLVSQQHLEDWSDSPPIPRISRLGGWPFSARHNGVACSDCTAEAFKAILLVESETDLPRLTTDNSIQLAVDNLLMIQNASGGYSSFEPITGSTLIEYLNGTELFGRVMVEYDYTECTGSAITALALFRQRDPVYRADDVTRAINRGVAFIYQNQREDGSWLADWGISCTYGAFFAMETLHTVGQSYNNHPAVRKGCDFLIGKQQPDGGWGETMQTIITRSYVHADQSHTVQTAWSCMALMHAAYPHQEPIKRGIQLIMSRQKENGEWKQEDGVGGGILTCQLYYNNYIYSFPIMAVNMYRQTYGDDAILE